MATIQSAGRRETTVSPITEGPDIVVLARNVQKSFNGVQVLKGIDLEVHRGKVVAILGPSGSGKSTFLRCINHLEKMEAGSIQVDGVQIGYVEKDGKLEEAPYSVTAKQRSRIGMVFQSFNLFPHMTVLENVMEVPVHVHGENPDIVRERALNLLARVGLGKKRTNTPSAFRAASSSAFRLPAPSASNRISSFLTNPRRLLILSWWAKFSKSSGSSPTTTSRWWSSRTKFPLRAKSRTGSFSWRTASSLSRGNPRTCSCIPRKTARKNS